MMTESEDEETTVTTPTIRAYWQELTTHRELGCFVEGLQLVEHEWGACYWFDALTPVCVTDNGDGTLTEYADQTEPKTATATGTPTQIIAALATIFNQQ